jgi:hypothetical protein
MTSSMSLKLLFENSLSSDEWDLEELLNDDDTKYIILILAAK